MKLPPRTFKKKYEQQHGRCFYCAVLLSDVKFEIDHIIPYSKSRNGQVKNLCLACFDCNRAKSNKTLEDFKRLIQEKLIRGMFYFEFINIY